jgi:hypothetical protein
VTGRAEPGRTVEGHSLAQGQGIEEAVLAALPAGGEPPSMPRVLALTSSRRS